MNLFRTRFTCCTLVACLLAAGAAFGVDDRRRDSDDNADAPESAPENNSPSPSVPGTQSDPNQVFYSSLTGVYAEEVVLPEVIVNDEDVIMVYQHNFGIYPFVSSEGEVVNGGLPQSVRIQDHLRELERDIDRMIPEDFDGYVIIDYEDWNPFWEDNAARYRIFAVEQMRAQKPNWDDARIERKARKDFERAAKKFMMKTLDKCHAKRPNAKFGYWSYPKAKFRDNNTRWLWRRHDAFFPAIYMLDMPVPDDVEPGLGEENESVYIEEMLVGRVAYARELAGDDKRVMAVIWPRYSNNNDNQWLRLQDLTQENLTLCMERPFDYGADGIVIWDNIPQPGFVETFQDQMDFMIAPEIRRILTAMGLPTDGEEDAVDPGDDDEPVEGLGGSDTEQAGGNTRR